MTDISPYSGGTPARRSNTVPAVGVGMVLGGAIVALIGVLPLVIFALVVGLIYVGFRMKIL